MSATVVPLGPPASCQPMPSRRPHREHGIAADARGARPPAAREHPARPSLAASSGEDPDAVNVATPGADVPTMVVAEGHPGADGADSFAALLDAAGRGSPIASRLLYESLGGRVCGYLALHGARDPDDLTNEVFLRVFRNLDRFAGSERDFRAWVFTIARRILLDEQRRIRRRPVTVELAAPLETLAGGDVEEEAIVLVEHEGVEEMLAALTPDQREVVALRIVADLSIDHVAAVLGKEPGTVKALQHRGLAALRRHLERART